MDYREIKPKRITEPRGDIPTYYELSAWLSQGKGEILAISSNTVMHSVEYSLAMQDEPITDADLERFRIRLMDTYDWNEISLKYMHTLETSSRWSYLKFVAYADAYYDEIYLNQAILTVSLMYKNHRIATTFALYKPNAENDGFSSDYIPWSYVTDADIIRVTDVLDKLGAAK